VLFLRVFGIFGGETGIHGTNFPCPLELNSSQFLVGAVPIAPKGAESPISSCRECQVQWLIFPNNKAVDPGVRSGEGL